MKKLLCVLVILVLLTSVSGIVVQAEQEFVISGLEWSGLEFVLSTTPLSWGEEVEGPFGESDTVFLRFRVVEGTTITITPVGSPAFPNINTQAPFIANPASPTGMFSIRYADGAWLGGMAGFSNPFTGRTFDINVGPNRSSGPEPFWIGWDTISIHSPGGLSYTLGFYWSDDDVDIVVPPTPPTLPETQNISVTLNGEYVTFDQPPIIQDGRTLVPLRAIFEALGADVEWDGAFQMVTATKGDVVVRMQIGNNVMTRNGQSITLDVPPQIVNDRTLAPARAVAESFGASVNWDEATQTIIIVTE